MLDKYNVYDWLSYFSLVWMGFTIVEFNNLSKFGAFVNLFLAGLFYILNQFWKRK